MNVMDDERRSQPCDYINWYYPNPDVLLLNGIVVIILLNCSGVTDKLIGELIVFCVVLLIVDLLTLLRHSPPDRQMFGNMGQGQDDWTCCWVIYLLLCCYW